MYDRHRENTMRSIPKRQLLSNRLMSLPSPFLKSWTLEKHFANFIFWLAGKEPYFWNHYGKDCVCCKWGWHK